MAPQKPYITLSRMGKIKRVKRLVEQSYKTLNTPKHSSSNFFQTSELRYQPGPSNVLPQPLNDLSTRHTSRPIAEPEMPVEDDFGVFEFNRLSDESSNSDDDSECDYLREMRNWSLKFNVTHVAISALLCILRSHRCFEGFPKDSRTFLNTPSFIEPRPLYPGHYIHIGIQNGIRKIWNLITEGNISSIELLLNADGLPLFKSSCGELWPILGSVMNVPSIVSTVFPIGIYYGPKKPQSCCEFLKDTVDEIVGLINNGILIEGKKVTVLLKGLCCDVPAKAFMLGIKGHNGYFSCSRCKQEGQYVDNRVTFPLLNCPVRTHDEFLDKTDADHYINDTPLVNIPNFNLISSVALDYMHLVCLGVVRTFMSIWVFGKAPLKFPYNIVQAISTNLINLQTCIPYEFSRKPRSLDDLKRWKATEFRQFLLYTGPLALANVFLPHHQQIYHLFMSLHVSVTILLSPTLHKKHHSDAKLLLHHFVESFKEIYGQRFITHNFHGLTHLADDVLTFGALDSCSAFKFENYLYTLKKLVRKGERPLQQIVKRLGEISNNMQYQTGRKQSTSSKSSIFSGPFSSGLLDNGEHPAGKEFKFAQFENFKLSVSSPNNCCLLHDGSIILVFSFVSSNSTKHQFMICKKFLTIKDFYSAPCPSSHLGIFEVSNLAQSIQTINVNLIKHKLKMALLYAIVSFPDENTTAVVPTSWIKEDTCKYPSKSTGQIEKLIRQNHVPDISWPSYNAAIIKKYRTYQAARLDLPRSEETSNLETEEEENRKRKIKPNRNLFNYPGEISSDEEDNQLSHTVPSFPKLVTFEQENISPNQTIISVNTNNKQASSNNQKSQNIHHNSVTPSQQNTSKINHHTLATPQHKMSQINHHTLATPQHKTSKINHHTPATHQHNPEQINHNFQTNNLLYSPNTAITTNLQTLNLHQLSPRHTLQNAFSPMPNNDHQASPMSASATKKISNEEIWEGLIRVQSTIVDLSTQLKNMETKFNAFMEMNARLPRAEDTVVDTEQEKLISFFPLDSMEAFIELENHLITNKPLQIKIVKIFASYGGHDVRSHTLNIMRRLMTDNLATYFSYTGKKASAEEKTTPFGPTLICQKVQTAVLKMNTNSTESSVKKHLMVFLNQAKTRIIRKESKGAEPTN